jgi:hypothetical protein
MFNKILLAAVAVGLWLNLTAQFASNRARADVDLSHEIGILTHDVAALNTKVDNMSGVLSHADDVINGISKKLDGLLYGSCQNRRICEFH